MNLTTAPLDPPASPDRPGPGTDTNPPGHHSFIDHPPAQRDSGRAPPSSKSLTARWARDESDVRRAQRLRHAVFVEEFGARVTPPRGTPPGHEADVFDPFCEHLLVHAGEDPQSAVVATCRVLMPDAARRAGGLYGETEFDLTRLRPMRHHLLEQGRACVHPDWRRGPAMLLMWSALAGFMRRNGLRALIGCASVDLRDGGHTAADLWQQMATTHLAPIEQRVRARLPLPVEALATGRAVTPPPLIAAYLRFGARLLGPPAWDPDFGSADLPLLLQLEDMPQRAWRRFVGDR
jgi:putative hemolysin